MTVTKIPIWLSCDPGHDDIVAILLSCFHPAFQLTGVSTCYGNASLNKTDYNCKSILTAMGQAKSVPVYRSSDKPWLRDSKTCFAPDIHGVSGLDGTDLLPVPDYPFTVSPPNSSSSSSSSSSASSSNSSVGSSSSNSSSLPPDMDFINALEEAILLNVNQITLISTGSITPFATFFKSKPHLKDKIKFLSIMGGSFNGVGNKNLNLSSEFNIWVDPHAAEFILTDEILKSKCILCPLNLTHKLIATDTIIDKIYNLDKIELQSNLRKLFYDLFQFFKLTYKNVQDFKDGPPIHDPVTLFPLLQFYNWSDESLVKFKFKKLNIAVKTNLNDTDVGQTYILYPDMKNKKCKNQNEVTILEYQNTVDQTNFEHYIEDPNGVIVGYDMNVEFFWEQILTCLKTANSFSTIEN